VAICRVILLVLVLLLAIAAVPGCGPPKQYSLSIGVYPEGAGDTDPAPGTVAYDEGTEVAVTAAPAAEFEFDRWTLDGDDFGTTPTVTVTVGSDQTLTALFRAAVPDYTLSVLVAPPGAGETSPPVGTYSYRAGTEIFLGATPAPGYRFVEWALNGVGVDKQATMSVIMDRNVALVAVFEAVTTEHALTLSVLPEDAGETVPPQGTYTYDAGTRVPLGAVAAEGFQFVRWTVNGSEYGADPTTEIVINADTVVTAVFQPRAISEQFTLTIDMSPTGAGQTVPDVGEHTYQAGSIVALSAAPNLGKRFVRWTRDGAEYSVDAETSVTMDSDIHLTAVFESEVPSFTLTIDVAPALGGATSPSAGLHTYSAGTEVPLSATPATGFAFTKWMRDGEEFSFDRVISVTVDSDAHFTAIFESRSAYALDVAVFPRNAGTTEPPVGRHTYDAGSVVPIAATPAHGHKFVKWTLAGLDFSANASTTLTMDADLSVVAEFALDPEAGPIPVEFPDANLEAAVRKALNVVSGEIYTTDLEGLEDLYANYSSIRDLTGLEYCPNLQRLYLAGNAIADLTPIKNLVRLTALNVAHNEISDAAPLKSLVNLTWLNLSHNKIAALEMLSGLAALETLFLSANQIEAVDALSGLTHLGKLYLSENTIQDVSALQSLPELSRLYLDCTAVREIDALVANMGIGEGDYVDLRGDPLSQNALCASIPTLEARGADVAYDGGCGVEYGWRHYPETSHYYAETSPGTWAEAEAEAVALGGHLVAVGDGAENGWLVETFVGNDRHWIGLSALGQEGSWNWSNGEAAAFTNWAPGEPDGSDPLKNVVVLNRGSGGQWETESASGVLVGIVERDGHQDGPSAAFSANVSSGVAPLIVHFEDQSVSGGGPIANWVWDFGDPESGAGNVRTEQNVSHVFNAPGVYTVMLTVTSDYGVDTAQREIVVAPGNGTVLNDRVVFLDDHPSLLVDTVFGDSLRLTYSGNGAVGIRVGDILVGTHGGGYLRRVLSVAQNGQLVVLATEPASLVEILEEANITLAVRTGGDDAEGALKDETTSVSLDGVTMGSSNEFLVTFSGVIDFAPTLDLEIRISHNSLEYFRMVATGGFSLDVGMSVSSAGPVAVSEETVFSTTQKAFETMAGPVPIVGTVDLSFVAQATGAIEGAAAVSTGFDCANQVALGAEYESEEWQAIKEVAFSFNGHPTMWEPDTDLGLAVSITPRIEVAFYEFEGPRLTLTTFADLQEHLEATNVQQEITASSKTCIDIELGAIDDLVAGPSWDAEGTRQTIYTWSGEIAEPDLFVGTRSVTLSPSAPSISLSIINAGTGTLSWTAFSNDPRVSVSPASFTGNSAEVSIGATDFSESYPALVTFTNADDPEDHEVVNVAVTGSASPGDPTPGEFVDVAAGWFEMGRREDEASSNYELPRHDVYLGFYSIGKYEVTNAEFAGVLNWALARGYLANSAGNAYTGQDVFAFGQLLLHVMAQECLIRYASGEFIVETRDGIPMANHPVVEVSWYGAVAYCNWLSETNGLTPCYNLSNWERISPLPDGFRLPTEAEWERAAAWDAKHWIYGFQSDTLDTSRCNYAQSNPLGLTAEPFTTEVGYFNGSNPSRVDSPSPVGCYDMSGNVWEWCHDWYANYSKEAQINPTGPDAGSGRIVRGGSWYHPADNARTANRPPYSPSTTNSVIGFRVVKSPPG